jgi:hypothetical protein
LRCGTRSRGRGQPLSSRGSTGLRAAEGCAISGSATAVSAGERNQTGGVAAIGLDPIARTPRDRPRRHHAHHEPALAARPGQAKPGRAGLIHRPHRPQPLQERHNYSIIQRKLLDPNDFESTAELARTLNAFEHQYNQIAEPFAWDFTRQDLAELLARLDEPAREQRAPLALAA